MSVSIRFSKLIALGAFLGMSLFGAALAQRSESSASSAKPALKRAGDKALVIGSALTQAQCSNGTPSKIVTHLSTESDGTGRAFISALIARNAAPTSANFFVCGFATDGTFIGGSSVTLSGNGRMFATSAATPITLSQLLGGAALGSRPFQIWLYDSPGAALYYEYGFVGNQGQFLAFTPVIAAPYPNGTPWIPSHAGADGFYNTLFYLSNASTTTATTFEISVLDDDGNVLAGGVATGSIPPRGRATVNFGAIIGTLPFKSFYGVSIKPSNATVSWSGLRVITYPTTGVGGGGVSLLPQF